jgi:hypothetical protein
MRATDERKKELDEQIAALKRRRKELDAADKAAARKARTRGLCIIGGVVEKVAEKDPKVAEFLRAVTKNLNDADREILSSVFPAIFPAEPSSSNS